MKHLASYFIASLFMTLAASLTGTYKVGTLDIPLSSIFTELAAALLGLTVLAGIYKLVGEEETVSLLRQLLAINRSASELAKLGIQRVIRTRTEMDIYSVHDQMRHSKEVYIASRNFNAIKYTQVQSLFAEIASHAEARIRIIVTDESEARARLCAFLDALPRQHAGRCAVRTTSRLSVGIYGWEHGSSIILYTNLLPGSECPVIQCAATASEQNSLHSLYRKEFNELWQIATPISLY